MWTAPCLQEESGRGVRRIACAHMCGFDARWAPPSWYPRRVLQAMTRHWLPLRAEDCHAYWIDRSHHLPFSCKFRPLARVPRAKPSHQFLCSIANRFPVPTTNVAMRRTRARSRSAQRPQRGAEGVLEGARVRRDPSRVGGSAIIMPSPRAPRPARVGCHAGADRTARPSPSSSRRYARFCWRARPRRVSAAYARRAR